MSRFIQVTVSLAGKMADRKVRACIWWPENADVNIQKTSLALTGEGYESKTDQDETPLHLAAQYSRADVVKRLLDNAVDVNSRDQHNRTPLHLAIGADAQEVLQVNI